MNSNTLNLNIKLAFYTSYGNDMPIKYKGVLSSLDHLLQTNVNDNTMLTKVKVVLEGVYQSIETADDLKMSLKEIRNYLWQMDEGNPSAEFIQLYQKQIEETKNSINTLNWVSYNHDYYSANLSNLWHIKE